MWRRQRPRPGDLPEHLDFVPAYIFTLYVSFFSSFVFLHLKIPAAVSQIKTHFSGVITVAPAGKKRELLHQKHMGIEKYEIYRFKKNKNKMTSYSNIYEKNMFRRED